MKEKKDVLSMVCVTLAVFSVVVAIIIAVATLFKDKEPQVSEPVATEQPVEQPVEQPTVAENDPDIVETETEPEVIEVPKEPVIHEPTVGVSNGEDILYAGNVTIDVDFDACVPEGVRGIIKPQTYGDKLIEDIFNLYDGVQNLRIDKVMYSSANGMDGRIIYQFSNSDVRIIYDAMDINNFDEPYLISALGDKKLIVFEYGIPANVDEIYALVEEDTATDWEHIYVTDYRPGDEYITLIDEEGNDYPILYTPVQ